MADQSLDRGPGANLGQGLDDSHPDTVLSEPDFRWTVPTGRTESIGTMLALQVGDKRIMSNALRQLQGQA